MVGLHGQRIRVVFLLVDSRVRFVRVLEEGGFSVGAFGYFGAEIYRSNSLNAVGFFDSSHR